MKTSISIISIILIGSLFLLIGCKSKKEMNDPTQLDVNLLVELNKDVAAKRLKNDLKQFDFGEHKLTNKTINQLIYTVTLKGQTADELIKAAEAKEYVKSARIAPSGDGPAENMPSGKSTRTKPVKG